MDKVVERFLQADRLAVVGVSRSGKKFGNSIFKELKERGYPVFIVHPEAREIDGEPCYTSLAALKGRVDGVVICVPPEKAGQALREAVDAGIDKIWLQQGAQSPEVLAAAKELGVEPVAGKCILMYAQPVGSVHAWHRGFMKLFGRL